MITGADEVSLTGADCRGTSVLGILIAAGTDSTPTGAG